MGALTPRAPARRRCEPWTCARRLLSGIALLALALAALPTAADDGIRLGVFPRRPAADTQRMFQPLADYLAARLGVPVSLETVADYPAFWSAIEQGRYDLVHYNHYQYVRAHREFGHQVVARNVEFGEAFLRAAIYVRSDSPYRALADLRGRKILFGGDRTAFVSHILATQMLRDAGMRDGDYIAQFAQNPVKAVIALHYMQADAAAAGDNAAALPLVRDAIGDGQLRALAYSMPVPHLPWAVSAALDPARRDAVRDALLGIGHSAAGRRALESMQLDDLQATADADYAIVRDTVAQVLGERY